MVIGNPINNDYMKVYINFTVLYSYFVSSTSDIFIGTFLIF